MILVDANILIYAFDADSPQHASARRWLDGRLNDTARVALPWPSLLAFLRIVANPRVMQRPAGMELARTSANLARLSGCLNTTTWRTSRRHSRCDPCDPLRSWEPRDGCAPGCVGDRARFAGPLHRFRFRTLPKPPLDQPSDRLTKVKQPMPHSLALDK